MKASYRRIMLTVALLLPLLAAMVLSPAPTQAATTSALDFRNQMRKLWEDHITWTRLTIVGVFTDDPETPTTIQRLLQNQVDIGNAIKPYYGDAAGDQLTALLHDHITGAAELLKAAKAGDQAAIKAASDKWYANGDQIATFLSTANPQQWRWIAMGARLLISSLLLLALLAPAPSAATSMALACPGCLAVVSAR